MSGWSISLMKTLTLGELRANTADLPDDYVVMVPSLNREPGQFIAADHLFVDPKDKTVSLDGDIAEARKS